MWFSSKIAYFYTVVVMQLPAMRFKKVEHEGNHGTKNLVPDNHITLIPEEEMKQLT